MRRRWKNKDDKGDTRIDEEGDRSKRERNEERRRVDKDENKEGMEREE